ncbi:MAG: peptidoglycan editing factor PgeF [Ignavibacteriaceae bacterium]|nr:peptidoglycan editing factor PgeF [Ignavibacteriaceae bacterium]
MISIKPSLFAQFPELVFGFATRLNGGSDEPYGFNLSLSVGQDEEKVLNNRRQWLSGLGLDIEHCAFQKQVHGDRIRYVTAGGIKGESDAMITDTPGLGIVISSADCPAIFIYDPVRKMIAGIHSGWKGSQKKILEKTVNLLINGWGCNPADFYAYIGPCISGENYEVGEEVAVLFDPAYLQVHKGSFYLDLKKLNYEILVNAGVPKSHIRYSELCTWEHSSILHSYRKHGTVSGRALGVLAMKEL